MHNVTNISGRPNMNKPNPKTVILFVTDLVSQT